MTEHDGTWHVQLGAEIGGIEADAVVSSAAEAAEWLRANAVTTRPATLPSGLRGRPMILDLSDDEARAPDV